MTVYYDLHIHSCLSPCGDEDMTPNNIVNMSILKGLDVIAVTDHNTCGNVRSVLEVAGDNILVIPGMEVTTSEEVHVLCYFPTIEQAEAMEKVLKENRMPIKNKAEIFGHQLYMDAEDKVVGEEEYLLVAATMLSIDEVVKKAAEIGGIAVPAHIDKPSYSLISNLGFMPEDLNVTAVEISPANRKEWEEKYSDYAIITDSDAHFLGDISEPVYSMDIKNKNIDEFLAKLTNKKYS